MRSVLKIAGLFLVLTGLTVLLSYYSNTLWGGKSEQIAEVAPLVFRDNMTVEEFGRMNELPNMVLREVFGLQNRSDLQRELDSFGLNRQEIERTIRRNVTISAEYESRNWLKIPLKFGLWITFLIIAFIMMRRERITRRIRLTMFLSAILLFGIILGSDPNPMGTVKDAIVLYGQRGVIFPPRLIAFLAFLSMVILANKFICSWGCQFGVLQDAIFRLNRDSKDRKSILPQFKLPFALTNSIRIVFFIVMTALALLWSYDVIAPIDPFKVFHPAVLGLLASAFIGLILVAAVFVWRPWCHLFCPFGLAGWIFEKLSIFKIQVDYETCTACEICAKACPSTVMRAILKRDRVIPDCFACGTCINACPVNAIHFKAGKRDMPPSGKFE